MSKLDRQDRDQIHRTGKDLHGCPIASGKAARLRGKRWCPGCKKIKHRDDMLGKLCEDCTKKADEA